MSFSVTPVPPARGAACPPAFDLEALAAGEERAAASSHVEGCASCRQYLDALKVNADAFVKARPAELFFGQVQRRAASQPKKRFGLAISVALAACLAAVVLTVNPAFLRRPPVTFKGDAVKVFVKRGEATRALGEGEPLHADDAVRFQLKADTAGYAVVFERDPSGKVSVVAPFAAAEPQPVVEGTNALQDSAVLDDALGTEEFIVVFSEQPFAVDALAEQLSQGREAKKLDCEACRVKVLRYEKAP